MKKILWWLYFVGYVFFLFLNVNASLSSVDKSSLSSFITISFGVVHVICILSYVTRKPLFTTGLWATCLSVHMVIITGFFVILLFSMFDDVWFFAFLLLLGLLSLLVSFPLYYCMWNLASRSSSNNMIRKDRYIELSRMRLFLGVSNYERKIISQHNNEKQYSSILFRKTQHCYEVNIRCKTDSSESTKYISFFGFRNACEYIESESFFRMTDFFSCPRYQPISTGCQSK